MTKLTIIFQPRIIDEGRAPNELLFVEVNDENGKSVDAGEWSADGEHESLTIDCNRFATLDFAYIESEFIKAFDKRMKSLRNIHDIAVAPGNGDANDYMRGMANGFILALATMEEKEPSFLTGATVEQPKYSGL